jgi:hypothetical protein
MRHRLLATVALGSLPLLSACQGAVWGNLAVLAITVGIFVGTISLGRR